jgi:SnoaL-like protein
MAMREEIRERVAVMLDAIDRLDWTAVRAAFASTVTVDYTSLFGGSVETLAADGLLERWRGLLPGFEATQHLIGPVIVTGTGGDTAVAETQVRGYHHVPGAGGGASWMAAGRYRFAMRRGEDGWRIAGLTLELAYQEGNRGLPAIAQSRVAAGTVRSGRG